MTFNGPEIVNLIFLGFGLSIFLELLQIKIKKSDQLKYFLFSLSLVVGTTAFGTNLNHPKEWRQQSYAALKIIEDGKIVETKREGSAIAYWVIYKSNMFHCRSFIKNANRQPIVLAACTPTRVKGFR